MYDRKAVEQKLNALSGAAQVVFAGLCAERLMNCYLAFALREDLSSERFAKVLDWIFDATIGNTANLEHNPTEQMEEHLFDAEEYGDPLASQARDAVIAMLYALQALKDPDVKSASNSAMKVVEAIDNYCFFTATQLLRIRVMINMEFDDSELMWREIQRQLYDLERLKTFPLTKEKITQLRIENRYFMVPPALEANEGIKEDDTD